MFDINKYYNGYKYPQGYYDLIWQFHYDLFGSIVFRRAVSDIGRNTQ